MNMEVIFGKARLLRTLTSLDRAEFVRLEEAMEELLSVQRAEQRHDGRPRQRAFGAGGPGKLPTTKARLLFILFYFKCYPLQEVLAFLFGLSQPQACEWIKKLTPQINAVLGRELLVPARRPADLDTLLKEVPELRLLGLDGVERPVHRPKDKDDHKKNYSGKTKSHRKKNLLISSEKRVVYLGPTSPGSVHDKKLADQSGLTYPPDALVVKDSGFQGYEPPDTDTLQPKKKPRGRELHPIQKTINQLVSRVRVTVEHAIAGIKRCHIVANTFRNRRRGFVDEVMLAASGLHNLRVATRTA